MHRERNGIDTKKDNKAQLEIIEKEVIEQEVPSYRSKKLSNESVYI